MTKDQITAWAREADLQAEYDDYVLERLERFAALVAAAAKAEENEACAKQLDEDASHYVSAGTVGHTIRKCASAIRARSNA